MARMTGNRFIAETLAGYGVDHVFFVPAGTYKMLAAMEGLGIRGYWLTRRKRQRTWPTATRGPAAARVS